MKETGHTRRSQELKVTITITKGSAPSYETYLPLDILLLYLCKLLSLWRLQAL